MSDSILVVCRACRHEFRLRTHLEGKQIRCPYCGREIVAEANLATRERTGDQLVGREIGGCRLAKRLGAGAMGAVYLARQLNLDREVAVKLLSTKAAGGNPDDKEDLIGRFRREARIAATIQHPHVVAVYDHGHEKGVHFLVMEYVEGDTLSGILREQPQGRLGWRGAARFVLQVAEALDRLADDNIIHRDIKPANILVSTTGTAKIADLGLAKQNDLAPGSVVTMPGAIMGSPAYMSPEQTRDSSDLTPATDVYSLGATFYHAVTGEPPYTGKNSLEIIRKIAREPFPAPNDLVPDLPQGINDLILWFMEAEPKYRPQRAADAIQEIVAALEAPAVKRRPRRRRRYRRR